MNEMVPLDVPLVLFVESMQVGGTAAYATALAIRLVRRGHRVAVLYPPVAGESTSGMSSYHYLNQMRAAGVAVCQLKTEASSSVRSRVARTKRLVDALRSYDRPAVLLLMGYIDGGGPVTLAARLSRARAVIRAELQPPMPPLTSREVVSARGRDIVTDLVVVGSQENRRMLAELMGRQTKRVRVIHTGIDLPQYEPGMGRTATRGELGYRDDEVVVGTISRLVERKGVADFIDAAALIAPTHLQVRFLIVGDGIDRQLLEHRAQQAGITDRTRFTGYRSDVIELLAAMDMFVMPSHFEGGPMILLEAMAMALPILATKVGMVQEVVEDHLSGRVVEPGDKAGLASAMDALLVNPPLRRRLGTAARARVARDLTLDAMTDAYLAACGEVAFG